MAHNDHFWKLECLSDAQLLEGLSSVLRGQRRTLAELVAHLGELEERRLHLEAACSSMFVYCVSRLGMSEDEACRRIELARLARRFPALFAELEGGHLSLSVALVLKPILTPDNHRELLCAARGKSTQQARELVAARCPKPDAPSSIRKLPERRPVAASDGACSDASTHSSGAQSSGTVSSAVPASAPELPARLASPQGCHPEPNPASLAAPEPTSPHMRAEAAVSASEGSLHLLAPRAGSGSISRCIEPLSAGRYRIQFTADADLKHKLELARDLLRHAHPSGDFALVVARALELLLDDLQRRRFGAGARRSGAEEGGAPPRSNARAHSEAAPPEASRRPCAAPDVAAPGDVAGAHCEVSTSEASRRPCAAPDVAVPGDVAGAHCEVSTSEASRRPCAAPDVAAPGDVAAPSTAAHSATSAVGACANTSPSPNAAPAASKPHRSHIPRAARRVVFERAGLGCSWVDANGVRCGSRAWLELDHRQPVGKQGSSEPDNLRLLCRAHNHFVAERVYGREHMKRASTRRRGRERSPGPPR